MRCASVVRAGWAVTGVFSTATPSYGQARVSADLGLFSAYVWRGLSLTNRPVAQPDFYLTFPAGSAALTVGGWANVELGRYDDTANDLSESGGMSALDVAEVDAWAEVSAPVEKLTLTGGALLYVFPNGAGFTSGSNTVEVYARAALDASLSPKLAVWYDVDKIGGAYLEASIAQSVPLDGRHSLTLNALAGLDAGQSIPGNPGSPDLASFHDDGFTHLDLSAGMPLTTGGVALTPAVHLVITGDRFTRTTSPGRTHDLKVWGGAALSWSKALGRGSGTME
ncbi:MAG TPA: TorF family putative porin [Gemmatimonadales bacterium]|jgi:hypothetical protein|nr:TorF family putative porin [Gemmatimonadales bacterium]